MNPSADTLILATLAGVAVVFIGLVVSIVYILRARRTQAEQARRLLEQERALEDMAHSQEQLLAAQHQRERELDAEHARTREDLRGQSVAREQTEARLREKQDELEAARREQSQQQERYISLQQEHTQLRTQLSEREQQHEEQVALLKEARDNLKGEFQNLANQIFEDKGKSFTSTSRATLEDMLKPFREQISTFQTRIDQVHTDSVKGRTQLEGELKKVLEVGLEMNSQASNLASALKGDKKTTGNWGEAQLERTLELAGLQPGEHYETQAAFRDEEGKRRIPDFVIKLPDGKNLVVDSKVSLVDYDRAIAAESEEGQTEALAAHAQAVRNHIDDLATKDYANLPGMDSPSFVLMFMPVEPAYIEAMKHNKELFNYGYQKGVIMVSHTTLMPILRTVANLWIIDKSNKEAREISTQAGEIYNQVVRVVERLGRLGGTLNTAQNHFNETVKSLVGRQGLIGKVDRFQQVSAKANKDMPQLDDLGGEFESDRLDLAVPDKPDAPRLVEDSGDDKVKPIKADK